MKKTPKKPLLELPEKLRFPRVLEETQTKMTLHIILLSVESLLFFYCHRSNAIPIVWVLTVDQTGRAIFADWNETTKAVESYAVEHGYKDVKLPWD